MLFTSGNYLIFLAIVFFAYWLVAAKRGPRIIFLLAVSYYFYALWNPRFLVLVFAISTIDFLTGLGIGATKKMGLRKVLLSLSLITDIGALFTFKYFNFF